MIGNRKVYSISNMRSGSKRIPGKCTKELAGYPLVCHTIDKLKKCQYIDDIFISTSDEEYKKFISDMYSDVKIHERPPKLSEDNVHHLAVFRDLVFDRYLWDDDDYLVFVDITKPFTRIENIEYMISLAEYQNFDSYFTVKKIRNKPVDSDSKYMNWGAVRIYNIGHLRYGNCDKYGKGDIHLDYPCIKDHEIDLDHPHDWIMAEALIKAGYKTQ